MISCSQSGPVGTASDLVGMQKSKVLGMLGKIGIYTQVRESRGTFLLPCRGIAFLVEAGVGVRADAQFGLLPWTLPPSVSAVVCRRRLRRKLLILLAIPA
jgi:hypothetical protein